MAMFYQPGSYTVQVIDQTMQRTKAKGHPMLVLKVAVRAQWNHERNQWLTLDQQYERTIWLAVDPNDETSQDRFLRKLRHAGWEGTDFTSADLMGLECVAECEAQAGDGGGQRENWNLPLPDRERQHDPSVAKSLNALFGAKLKKTAAKPENASQGKPQTTQPDPGASQPAAEAPAPGEAPPDDEIPF